MTRGNDISGEQLATCHVIIGHPRKPKFLVVRHSDGWSPPTVKFPPGPIDFRPEMINQGIQRKYGLKTHILRPLQGFSTYHVLEAELAGKGSRRLDAVWVGREQYERYRNPTEDRPDPFEAWLDERERHLRPGLRPPWEYPGWFDRAAHWIQFQLDRLQIHATGSVEQHAIGSSASCLLRVRTSEGLIQFKAGGAGPPGEATLTAALAQAFPDAVVAPLAIDGEQNWLLNRDYQANGQAPPDAETWAACAATLADVQIGSSENLPMWRELGCPVHDLDYLDRFVRDIEPLSGWLRADDGRLSDCLSDDEFSLLQRALRDHEEPIALLGGFAMPDMLVHTDFRMGSVVRGESGPAIMNWSDVVIGHPFFAMERIFGPHDRGERAGEPGGSARAPGAAKRDAIEAAYLPRFTPFADPERADEQLRLVRRLIPLWGFTRIAERLAWTEPHSVRYQRFAVWLRTVARTLIREASRKRAPMA